MRYNSSFLGMPVYKKTWYLLCFYLMLLVFSGCGDSDSVHRSDKVVRGKNHESVASLSALLTDSPEFARASLKEIKNAAQSVYALSVSDKHESSEPNSTSISLDHALAKRAQDLIDDILNNFDFAGQFEVDVKMLGITANFAKSQQASALKPQQSNVLFQEDDRAMYEAELNMLAKEFTDISCQELVDNPFVKFSEDLFDSSLEQNIEALKTSLSGCDTISGGKFAHCVNDINRRIELINRHASCDMKHPGEVLMQIESAVGREEFMRLGASVEDCAKTQFTGCGFKPIALNGKTPLDEQSK